MAMALGAPSTTGRAGRTLGCLAISPSANFDGHAIRSDGELKQHGRAEARMLELNENVPGIRFEDYFGEIYQDYGKRFPTAAALVEALLKILSWEQIRRLGRRDARMTERGDPTLESAPGT
jgi:hypothetical protein